MTNPTQLSDHLDPGARARLVEAHGAHHVYLAVSAGLTSEADISRVLTANERTLIEALRREVVRASPNSRRAATANIVYADLTRNGLLLGFELHATKLAPHEFDSTPITNESMVSGKAAIEVASDLMALTDSALLTGVPDRGRLWDVEIDESGPNPRVVAISGKTLAGDHMRIPLD